MTIQELFITSNQLLSDVVAQIGDDQWSMQLPDISSRRPTSLDDAIRYHTYDDAWVPDVLAGKTKEEVGDSYESLLKSEAVRAEYDAYNQRAVEAVKDYADLERVVHLSYGDFKAQEYLQHITSFRIVRSYDIAKMIGLYYALDDELAQALLDEYSPLIESYRQVGIFPPAVEAADDATPQIKLFAMFGRN